MSTLLLGAVALPASGQLVEETFSLDAGWNSVFLEVDPIPARADDLFAGLPFSTVWTPSDSGTIGGAPLDCLGPDDPNCTPEDSSDWHVWLPTPSDGTCDAGTDTCSGGPNDGAACSTNVDCEVDDLGRALRLSVNLHAIRGGRAYLIKATRPIVWKVVGQPSPLRLRWQAGYNFTGFHVDPADPPTFAAYLAPSPVHTNPSVFEKPAMQQEQVDGQLRQISRETPIAPGKAYWVSADADQVYDGPLKIDRLTLAGIDFLKNQSRHSITIENEADSGREITFALLQENAPADTPAGSPRNAGEVPLIWKRYSDVDARADLTALDQAFDWVALTNEVLQSHFGANGKDGGRKDFDFAVDRLSAADAATLDDIPPAQYQSVLAIKDGTGFRRLIPVAAQVPARHGLWVGSVSVNQVRWNTANAERWTNVDEFSCGCENGFCQLGPHSGETCNTQSDCECPEPNFEAQADPGDPNMMRPTAVGSEINFPVIMHLSAGEEWRLLQAVTLLFEPEGGNDPTAGRFVLATPSCEPGYCDSLEPGSRVDGAPFAPRLSTAGYALDEDLPLTTLGDFASHDVEIVGVVTLPGNHRLNPFHHQFHPDHDCDVAGECYAVKRSFRFIQDLNPPMGVTDPRWGFSTITGEYRERLTISATPETRTCRCAPTGTCVGPPHDGEPCEALPDCAPGECHFADTCVGGGTNDGMACTQDDDCGCPLPLCICNADRVCDDMDDATQLPTEGASCVTDADCGCGDTGVYSTDVRGRFTLTRVSEIDVLNGGHSR